MYYVMSTRTQQTDLSSRTGILFSSNRQCDFLITVNFCLKYICLKFHVQITQGQLRLSIKYLPN